MSLATAANAQASSTAAAPKHPVVCELGVKTYHNKSEIPTPFDTLTMPPSDGPIRVTNPEEAAAAEKLMLQRAGSVGATGLLVTTIEETTDGGQMRMRRSTVAVFVPGDTARAYAACKK